MLLGRQTRMGCSPSVVRKEGAEGSKAGQINTRNKPKEPPDSSPALACFPGPGCPGDGFFNWVGAGMRVLEGPCTSRGN